MKLLLVEDEYRLASVVQKGLKKSGFAVDTAYDGESALELIGINEYDLVILDLNLPKVDGFTVLHEIRKISNTIKVLILSSRNHVKDKVQGLDLGANDYLEKPFDFLELVARIRNLLRWEFVLENSVVSFGAIDINLSTQSITKDGIPVSLTKKEYSILEYLVKNRTRYISAEEIIEHVWESDVDLFSNSFKFHISSLKKKLSTENIIVTVRGKGYRFGGDGI